MNYVNKKTFNILINSYNSKLIINGVLRGVHHDVHRDDHRHDVLRGGDQKRSRYYGDGEDQQLLRYYDEVMNMMVSRSRQGALEL